MTTRPSRYDLNYVRRARARLCLASLAATAATAAKATVKSYERRLNPRPWHTSSRTGAMLVRELLNGHLQQIQGLLGMSVNAFRLLVAELREAGLTPTRHVQVEESVAIFMYMLVTNNSILVTGEMFQRSSDTISK
jgi:hypothetical protein